MSLADIFANSPIKPIQEHMDVVQQAVSQLNGFAAASQRGDWKSATEIQKQIDRLEQDADKLKSSVRTHLPKRLFMPVSRGDLLELVTAQDKMANTAKDVAGIILGRKIQFPKALRKEFRDFVSACVKAGEQTLVAVEELNDVFEVGFSRREVARIEALIKKIDKLEKQTDKLQVKLRASLFKIEDEVPPVQAMFLYKVIDQVGKVADDAERTGHRLHILIST